MRTNAAIWVTPLALVMFAGCLEGGGDAYHAYAMDGKFALGFAYDGKGVESFAGPAFLDADEAANTGVFVAQGKVAGTEYRIVFEDYSEAPGKKFQDGGIAGDFREHGASGVGDRTIPEVDLEMSAWGLATITTGGKPYKDPISGKDQWAAHYMVIRNGVRNDTSSQIHTKDHGVYSPDKAGEGLSTPGDYELHLVIRNQSATTTAATAQIGPFGSSSPNANLAANHKFTVAAFKSDVTIDYSVAGTGATASQVKFTVTSPSGKTVGTATDVGPGMAPAGAQASYTKQVKFAADEIGEYTISATGRIAPGGNYAIKGTIVPPPSIVMNFWWEDLTFGEEAEQKAESSGMLEGTKYHGMHTHAASGSATVAVRKLR